MDVREELQASAAVIYMMDVSGSMGREQKEIVRIEAFWIDTWLRSQYKNLEVAYIVHDAAAHLVDRAHVLPSARVGRDQDQLGLRAVPSPDRGALSRERMEHLSHFTSRTGITGA
jgi:hypothetical protein